VLEFIKSYKNEVVTVVVSNFMMLLFGYLGEIGVMERTMALIIGFLFFAFSFYTIYTNFAVKSDVGKRMFGLLVTVWAIYGIAYMFPTVQKNITYNGLDIVAKNFFGVYLYIVIQKLASQK
jgi:hypothetical protein